MLNYYCTWNAQNCVRPDAVLEPSAEAFLGADGAKKARDYLDETSIFATGGLADQFAPVRRHLYFLLDDGWDVPRGTHPIHDAAIESFGSLELAQDRFPSFPGAPAQRLRGVNEALQARGWRGAGLWVSAQARGEGFVSGFFSRDQTEAYWRTRLRWSREAGIGYWKIDWGCRQFDPQWRQLLEELKQQEYPQLHMEQCHPAAAPVNNVVLTDGRQTSDGRFADWAPWPDRWLLILQHAEIFRSYDVLWQFSQVSTLDRIAYLMQAAPAARAVINCEDEAYIGAVLGCSIGVMRSGLYRPIPVFDFDPQHNARKLREITRAVRWQEQYPELPVYRSALRCGEELVRESFCFQPGQTWMKEYEHHTIIQACPALITRGMERLPAVACSDTLQPLILASQRGDTVAAASLPRRDGATWRIPRAQLRLPTARHAGLFGKWDSVRIGIPPEGGSRVLARDLADDSWTDITKQTRRESSQLVIPGELIDRLCVCDDESAPGLELRLEGTINEH